MNNGKKIEDKAEDFKAHPGNDAKYLPDTLSPDENSPLAGMTMIFLGSSVTLGYASLDNSFVDFIQKKLGSNVSRRLSAEQHSSTIHRIPISRG